MHMTQESDVQLIDKAERGRAKSDRHAAGGLFRPPYGTYNSEGQSDSLREARRFLLLMLVLVALIGFAAAAIVALSRGETKNTQWALPTLTTIIGSFVGFLGGSYSARPQQQSGSSDSTKQGDK
jgi:hypothetical protein